MTGTKTGAPDAYDEDAMARLKAFVEKVVGGKIVDIERQVRWRPSWYVDLQKDGAIRRIYLRGDRTGDVAIFPDLKREGDVMSILERHGIPVPHIYGYCEDPPCIVMDTLPGTRDMEDERDPAVRASIGREYMRAVAAMHALPLEPFAAIGIHAPRTAEDIALVGLNAYLPLYHRTKSRPEPLLEFAIAWLRRNVLAHRDRPCFIQFDSGQFLFDQGRMTGLYDFEFSMIGDPMMDLATMAMRKAVEPLGSPFEELCEEYARASGEPVDRQAILFHTLQFATLGAMQFAGTVGRGVPGDPHSVYLEWNLSLSQGILIALSELLAVPLPTVPPLAERSAGNAALIAKIMDTLSTIHGAEPIDENAKDQTQHMLALLQRYDLVGQSARDQDLAEIGALLGRSFADVEAAELALETHVRQADAAEDAALFRLLAAIHARRIQVATPTRISEAVHRVTRDREAQFE
jgi:aminoglycoside phosphotransferase (APT) family kinase protein